ncbi:MAG: family 10 glycosylhydrolase [Candidatus Omnitrophota bacterium]
MMNTARVLFLALFFGLVPFIPAQSGGAAPRALFVSVVQDPVVLSSRREIEKLISFAKDARITLLFVQVYRKNQAWFPSEAADDAPYQKCLKDVAEDPFELLLRQAHRAGIQVHAWVNMLSLANNQDAVFLKKYGTEVLTRNTAQKKQLRDFLIDSQYFLEPGDQRVRGDLVKIVSELLRRYPRLDGIQFDYVRYPDTAPHYGYAKNNVERFKKATGQGIIDENSRQWQDWKRAQVTELLAVLVKEARALSPGIQVSATGCMPYARAYYEAYQDWPSWLSCGLVDFVTIMSYSPDPEEFARWLASVKKIVPDFSRIKIGVGAYKFLRSPQLFAQEFRQSQEAGGSSVIFHYGSLLEAPQLKDALLGRKKQ